MFRRVKIRGLDETRTYGATQLGASFNTATNTVVDTIPVGVNPRGMAVNSTGTRVYVSSTFFWSTNGTAPGLLQTIDTSTNTVVASVTVGNIPNSVAVSSDDSRVYVANTGSSLDGNALSVVDTVTVGAGPWAVATKP